MKDSPHTDTFLSNLSAVSSCPPFSPPVLHKARVILLHFRDERDETWDQHLACRVRQLVYVCLCLLLGRERTEACQLEQERTFPL